MDSVLGGGRAAADSGENGPSQSRGRTTRQRTQDIAAELKGSRNETSKSFLSFTVFFRLVLNLVFIHSSMPLKDNLCRCLVRLLSQRGVVHSL